MKITVKILLIVLIIPAVLFSQWSTTTNTADALWACPGFNSSLITYADGSAIIMGIGDGGGIWLQKTDPNGYKQWLPYVTVYATESADQYGPLLIPDDDGGAYVILGRKAQRVDKNGRLCWDSTKQQILPTITVIDQQYAVKDGQHGFLLLYNGFVSATQKQTVKLARYDSSGSKLWEKLIDTSFIQNSLEAKIIGKLGINTILYSNNNYYKLDSAGAIQNISDTTLHSHFFICEGDSVGYNIRNINDLSNIKIFTMQVNKFNKDLSLRWNKNIEMEGFDIFTYTGAFQFISPDGFGGIFFHRSFQDATDTFRIQINRIAGYGYTWGKSIIINNEIGRYPFISNGQIGFIYDSERAQKFDTSGKALWDSNFTVISDPMNSYFAKAVSDNNGGAIMSFWKVAGGIKVQHTGRNGKIGIITKVNSSSGNIPSNFVLYQNYPNPFNASTTLKFSIPKEAEVEVIIYDALGRRVETLVSEKLSQGVYETHWNANNYASGIYFYSIKSGSIVKASKMLLLK